MFTYFSLIFRPSSDIVSVRIKENPSLILNDALSDDGLNIKLK